MSFQTLITNAELAARLGDPSVVIVDCRHDLAKPDWGREEYQLAHIPGARFLHIDADLSATLTGRNGRHPLPDAATFAQTLGRVGITNSTQVVAYDAQGGMFAARLWWMLRHWLGHEAVAVLDGGLDAWKKDGRPLTADLPEVTPATYTLKTPRNVVDAAFVLAHLDQPGMTLVDARAADRFRGENETLDPVGGHIPGARNRFFKDNLDAGGKFKSPGVLREEFRAVVHQCGSGVTACHNVLAMNVAGLHGGRLYAGSWSEWCSDPSRPMAKG
jgi:thiosulfate/3-mercaptopyruvate sulfurtransferase